jgi:hypothetical protein
LAEKLSSGELMAEKVEVTESMRDGQASTEKTLDKTLADSFPTSDPPSTIPNPGDTKRDSTVPALAAMAPGTWAAISVDSGAVVATGASSEEAESNARRRGHGKFSLLQAPSKTDGTAAA